MAKKVTSIVPVEQVQGRLTRAENDDVLANCDHLEDLKFSPVLPYAFTEHGAIMAASVLNSERAVRASICSAFAKGRPVPAGE